MAGEPEEVRGEAREGAGLTTRDFYVSLYRRDLVQREWESLDDAERGEWADVLTIALLVATSGRDWPR